MQEGFSTTIILWCLFERAHLQKRLEFPQSLLSSLEEGRNSANTSPLKIFRAQAFYSNLEFRPNEVVRTTVNMQI